MGCWGQKCNVLLKIGQNLDFLVTQVNIFQFIDEKIVKIWVVEVKMLVTQSKNLRSGQNFGLIRSKLVKISIFGLTCQKISGFRFKKSIFWGFLVKICPTFGKFKLFS